MISVRYKRQIIRFLLLRPLFLAEHSFLFSMDMNHGCLTGSASFLECPVGFQSSHMTFYASLCSIFFCLRQF